MTAQRPTNAQVVLLVFALLLNAMTWVQARAAVAAVPQDMCLQAHGPASSAGDHGTAGVRDACIAHCAGLPAGVAGTFPAIAPPQIRADTAALPPRPAVDIVARRAVQQPRAPPAA